MDLKLLFESHPWAAVYGPVILVTVLTYVFKVLTKVIRDRRWTFFDRTYFYFGMPLIWASFGRALSSLISEISGNGAIDKHFQFFAGWSFCALFVFAIHAAYDAPESELLRELKFIWQRDKEKAAIIGRRFTDAEPRFEDLAALQRRNLVGIASLVGLATFVIFDYLFVGSLAAILRNIG